MSGDAVIGMIPIVELQEEAESATWAETAAEWFFRTLLVRFVQ
jgi:hypothetical protein